jgi:multidrug efflux pump subunit AcrA (membrane-fusion protein)
VDSSTRTVKVRGIVDNPERLLKAEMLATVEAPGPAAAGPAVPAGAVVLAGDRQVVFVEDSAGCYRRAEVRVGRERDSLVEVATGVAPGDHVVTTGALLLEHLYEGLAQP